jgi:hypothetical protein
MDDKTTSMDDKTTPMDDKTTSIIYISDNPQILNRKKVAPEVQDFEVSAL